MMMMIWLRRKCAFSKKKNKHCQDDRPIIIIIIIIQTCTKGIHESIWLSGKIDLLVIVQEPKVWQSFRMIYAQTSLLENETDKIL